MSIITCRGKRVSGLSFEQGRELHGVNPPKCRYVVNFLESACATCDAPNTSFSAGQGLGSASVILTPARNMKPGQNEGDKLAFPLQKPLLPSAPKKHPSPFWQWQKN